MLSKDEIKAKIMHISELAGDNEDIMNELASLQSEFDERDNATPQYTESDVMDSNGVRWSQRFTDMQTKYRERFFGGDPDKNTQPPDNNEGETSAPEAEEITFNDLFE